MTEKIYKPQNPIRIVTAASLFDGHDVAINLMRRMIQTSGAEVIHLGHDRSAEEVVNCAIQEDAQAIAVTSYQGGHNEYLTYMFDLLKAKNSSQIKIFGGGGGVILPSEIEKLMNYGITKIYSPDDGREMGLQGMINDLIQKSDFSSGSNINTDTAENLQFSDNQKIAKLISCAENFPEIFEKIQLKKSKKNIPVLGITGTGGAGKSTLTDELVRRFLTHFTDIKIAIISIDPSKKKTGGALLGDRIRMNAINVPNVYMRSMATRASNAALSPHVKNAVAVLKSAEPDLIILETSGIGQSGSEISDFADLSLYVMTPEFGAPSQLEKIDMLDFADWVAVNKSDKRGAEDALLSVKKQYQRNHKFFNQDFREMPVFSTHASQFNDSGITVLFYEILKKLAPFSPLFSLENISSKTEKQEEISIIPPKRARYLSEIVENNQNYNVHAEEQSRFARKYQQLSESKKSLPAENQNVLDSLIEENKNFLEENHLHLLENWTHTRKNHEAEFFTYPVRNKEIKVKIHTETLSHTQIPKVILPKYHDWGDILKWNLQEGIAGNFPFTAGIYPFKREEEDPTRMFAGEGSPERTNKRFHYVSEGMPAKRLSTAFDSVTLYGQDPDLPPDIYGKIGNAGVSVATLDDAKKLYSGFDLTDSKTSVSMTINGPAPMMLALFMNAAIDQECEKYITERHLEHLVEKRLKEKFDNQNLPRPKYHGELPKGNNGLGLMLLGLTGDEILDEKTYNEIKAKTMATVRGTVQADILKEDQAQNTCIFSTDFALRLMGDVQEYFILNKIQNFYSISISGYHIAEAGANPVTQLAFTLANGFTYVEYYLSRGMNINDFAPNLSFFFSNGIDAEYAVIGRVARRIWAKALKHKYKANERSQKLKYHIQTSGRSLHAQEIAFNDIRTTLQALYAIYDNCNSLHTNAYDEAITTPTEESVRRAMAIQLIINKELGLAKNENPMQGSFIIEELTDRVEEAVYAEFERISERGGVLGAMETMYQRSKIQEESLYYENLKHSGKYPIIGVNAFLGKDGSPTLTPEEIIRSTDEEKQRQVHNVIDFQKVNASKKNENLAKLKYAASHNKNIFSVLMKTVKYCSLGEITHSLFETGGKYRRNM
ncbi:MAG: methylmalonyl-CoA mutase family protein [Flavobacteriaceae bacterium]|jgi:methylmalonyl-CoA mutase|nr:methylmalonyl-CoA mutase family protein [Flavobacteriaceae bacterium]